MLRQKTIDYVKSEHYTKKLRKSLQTNDRFPEQFDLFLFIQLPQ